MGLPMAPAAETRTTTAARQDPSLLVLGDDTIYSVRLASTESVPSVRPVVAHWSRPDFSAMAACGSSILGILKDSRTVVVHDTVTNAAAPGTRLRGVKRIPVMLPVGDDNDTVVVMDRLLRRRRDGSSAFCFEALRRLPGGGWRADPLPDAPVEDLDDEELEDELGEDYDNTAYVSPYFVMGTRLWISVYERGTFSLDLAAGGEQWRVEGSWELPVLSHRAFFVPELGCAVGLVPSNDTGPSSYYDTTPCHQVCAIDVVDAQQEHRPPVVRHVWKFPTEHQTGVPPGEMIGLTYLGNGTFCMARCVIVDRYQGRGTSFTLLDLVLPGAGAGDEGKPQLAKRGEPHVHAWPSGRLGFACLFFNK